MCGVRLRWSPLPARRPAPPGGLYRVQRTTKDTIYTQGPLYVCTFACLGFVIYRLNHSRRTGSHEPRRHHFPRALASPRLSASPRCHPWNSSDTYALPYVHALSRARPDADAHRSSSHEGRPQSQARPHGRVALEAGAEGELEDLMPAAQAHVLLDVAQLVPNGRRGRVAAGVQRVA